MNGKIVEFGSNGTTFRGYVSEADGGGPGIIVIQEWWGLVDHIKDVCDRFAAAGFTALAPDLYNGESTKSPDEADKLMMALNIAETEKNLRGAIDFLLKETNCTSRTVGTVGFCMGGQLSLFAAASNPEKVSACVDFYGIHPKVRPPFENLKAPVLGFFGERDNSVDPEAVKALKEKLEALGKTADFTIYENTGHAFFNDTRPTVYNPQAAEEAWAKMLEFFKKNVK